MALLNSLYSRSKERISLPGMRSALLLANDIKKLSLPYQLLLLPQSLPQSASLRAVAVCVAVGWLCCCFCCCCELISSGAAFDSTQRDATQTRRDVRDEAKRRDAVSWKTFGRLPFGISLLANLRRVGRKNPPENRENSKKIQKTKFFK